MHDWPDPSPTVVNGESFKGNFAYVRVQAQALKCKKCLKTKQWYDSNPKNMCL